MRNRTAVDEMDQSPPRPQVAEGGKPVCENRVWQNLFGKSCLAKPVFENRMGLVSYARSMPKVGCKSIRSESGAGDPKTSF